MQLKTTQTLNWIIKKQVVILEINYKCINKILDYWQMNRMNKYHQTKTKVAIIHLSFAITI